MLRSLYSDGGSITWFEPPPSQTVTGPLPVSVTNKSLIKGSINEELSCNFSLTAGLRIIAVSMKIGGRAAATFVPNQKTPSVEPSFASRLNATWFPNKLTLILFNVTAAEEEEYLCQVVSVSPPQIWIRKIHVSLLGKLKQLVKRMAFIATTFDSFSFWWGGEGGLGLEGRVVDLDTLWLANFPIGISHFQG